MAPELPLVRSILAFPGLVLRRDWLKVQIREQPLAEIARDIDALCASAEALEEPSREALVAWVAVLVSEEDRSRIDELRREAHQAGYRALGRLLREYAVPSACNADKTDDVNNPAPNPVLGRDLTVGERRSLARMPNRREFDRLLLDPHPLVLRQLLANPKLTENDVVKLAALRPARTTTIKTLAEFPDWIVRTRVRMTLVSNPLTPSTVSVPLTGLATRPQLVDIASNPSLHVVLRVVAQELLEKHPPLGPASSGAMH